MTSGRRRSYTIVGPPWRNPVAPDRACGLTPGGANSVGQPRTPAAAILVMSVVVAKMRRATAGPAADARTRLADGSALTRLDRSFARLDAALVRGDFPERRRALREAVRTYSRMQPHAAVPPIALTILESMIGPHADAARIDEGRMMVGYMRAAVRSLSTRGADAMLGDACVFDAMRREVARVSVVGIAGFAGPGGGDAIAEGAEALVGVQDALVPYRDLLAQRDIAALARLDAALSRAIAYLRAHGDAGRFDRLVFRARYAAPAARALGVAQRVLHIGAHALAEPWRAARPEDGGQRPFPCSCIAAAPIIPPNPISCTALLGTIISAPFCLIPSNRMFIARSWSAVGFFW